MTKILLKYKFEVSDVNNYRKTLGKERDQFLIVFVCTNL